MLNMPVSSKQNGNCENRVGPVYSAIRMSELHLVRLTWVLGIPLFCTTFCWSQENGSSSNSTTSNHGNFMVDNGTVDDAINASLSRAQILSSLLDKTKYNSRIAPTFNQAYPTTVSVSIYINSFDSVSEANMDFSINFLINQTWMDTRLKFSEPLQKIPFLELDAKSMTDVWVPDLYFANEKKAEFHDITVPNKLMHLYENGTIVYSSRITMTATCHMRLHKYPLDTQVCPIYIKSFTYTAENVILRWKCQDCVQVDQESELPQFELNDVSLVDCTNRTPDEFTCLEASFRLVRHVGYYVIQIYIPCVLIVMLSWVSFWLDIDSVPARISLGILTVLTMTTQNDGAQGSLPKVSYIKAIDVWSSLCLFFVFAALLEYSIVNYLSRKQIKVYTNKSRHEENGIDACFNIRRRTGTWDTCDEGKRTYVKMPDVKARKRAIYIDCISRVAFPVTFLILLFIYWIFYIYCMED